MYQTFEIRPSKSQLKTLITAHAVAGTTIFFYLEPALFKLGGIALLALMAIFESKRLIQREIIILKLNLKSRSIELEQGGQPYFYAKNKVHQTRWFAILKLVDEPCSRTLILNSDCFDSMRSYQRLRYYLRKMEPLDAA